MTYAGEFRVNWPVLLGACVGLALGAALNHYMLNLFGPPLIAEFGWQKSQFALVGSLSLASLLFVPIAGRFADRFGPRIALSVGFVVVPLAFLAFSMMTGSILQFYAITLVNNIFGVLTTTLVFSRVIVERFDIARGMALSIVMSGAPLIGASMVPIIGEIIENEGWRAGYRTLAVMSAVGGIAAIVLVGRRRPRRDKLEHETDPSQEHAPMPRAQFFALVRSPVFILLVGGMFLVNFPQVIVASQLKLVLMESGAASAFATWLISLYAISVVVGRFASGLALDRFPGHRVALFALGLPAIGWTLLATPVDAGWALTTAIALIGLAQGAEGDVGAYITSRSFDMRHFSFIYSFLIAAMGAAMAVGSVVLSYTLHVTDRFDSVLAMAAGLTIVGALAIYWTGRVKGAAPHEPDLPNEHANAA